MHLDRAIKFCLQLAGIGVDQNQSCPRSVMANSDAGRGQTLSRSVVLGYRLEDANRSGGRFDLRGGDSPGTVKNHGALAGIENGRFESVTGGAGIEDGIDAAVKISKNVISRGGAGVPEQVGAGRCDRDACATDQRKRDWMGRHADADKGAAGGDNIGHGGASRQQQRKGSGPEGLHETACRIWNLRDQPGKHGFVGDVHDNRIPKRALLGDKDSVNRRAVECIGAEAIDGLGGHGNQAPGLQDGSRPIERFAGARVLQV